MAESLTLAQSSLRHRLQDIPESTRGHLRMGFSLLPSLNEQQQQALFEYILEELSSRAFYDIGKAAEISGCDPKVCGDLVSALAMTVSSVIDLDVKEDDFFRFVPEELITEDSKPAISKLLGMVFSSQEGLRRESESSKLANSVLPSLRYADIALDIRLDFGRDDVIKNKVPVALVYVATDSKQEIWFQLGRKELETFIADLTLVKRRMEIIDRGGGG
jgi:hypothetical protein